MNEQLARDKLHWADKIAVLTQDKEEIKMRMANALKHLAEARMQISGILFQNPGAPTKAFDLARCPLVDLEQIGDAYDS